MSNAILSEAMSIAKSRRYVVFGAGAVGAAIGGLLANAGSRVICVARPAHAEALRRGILLKKEDGEDVLLKTDAVTEASDLSPEDAGRILRTLCHQPSRNFSKYMELGCRSYVFRTACGMKRSPRAA